MLDQAIFYLLEFAKETKQKFLKQGASQEDVDAYLTKFQELRDKGILKGSQRDIGQYKTFNQLKATVDQASKVVTKTQRKKQAKVQGSEVVYDDANVTVYHVTTQDAACFYGSDTKWCISATKGKNYFKDYKDRGVDFYFIISKNRPKSDPLHKVAVAVYPEGEEVEVYNAEDNLVQGGVLKELGVDQLDVFKKYIVDLTTEEGFFEFLKRSGIKYTIAGNKVNIEGDLDLSHKGLTKFPVEFGVVTGNFDCEYNQLISLEGAPREVGGAFYCYDNQLTSLQGAPNKVGGAFICSDNQLTTLEGAPREVGDNFFCSSNQLTTLQGGPSSVGGSFYCFNNQLTTLAGAPSSVGGNFYCYDNPGNFTQQDIDKAMKGQAERVELAIRSLLKVERA